MAPTIQDGRVVLLNLADTEPRDGKIFAICKPDDGLVLKRLIWDFHASMGRQTWIMRSDNPDKIAHPDKVLPPDDRTMIAGRAVWTDSLL
jgi:phage repressor protein C with HTH and peptisase S24 domain